MTEPHLPAHPLDADAPKHPGPRPGHRPPYVGYGADGARRSADIDRAEADTVATASTRWLHLQQSASHWEQQAADLDEKPREQPGRTP